MFPHRAYFQRVPVWFSLATDSWERRFNSALEKLWNSTVLGLSLVLILYRELEEGHICGLVDFWVDSFAGLWIIYIFVIILAINLVKFQKGYVFVYQRHHVSDASLNNVEESRRWTTLNNVRLTFFVGLQDASSPSLWGLQGISTRSRTLPGRSCSVPWLQQEEILVLCF